MSRLRLRDSLRAALLDCPPELLAQRALGPIMEALNAAQGCVSLSCGEFSLGKPQVYHLELELEGGEGQISVSRKAAFSDQEQLLLKDAAGELRLFLRYAGLVQGLIRQNRSLQNLNEELNSLEGMKTELLRTVGHELRTPLANVRGYAQTLIMDPELEPALRGEFLGVILEESDRLLRLIESMMDLSRQSLGQLNYQRKQVQLEELVGGVIARHRSAAQEAGLNLSLDILDPCALNLDAIRVEQALAQLLENAIKHAEAKNIHIAQWHAGAEVLLSVRDDGSGIPQQHLPFLFDRFYQVGSSGSSSTGLGIGLALAQGIIQDHQGHIEVKSQPGEGAVFTIHLPLS